MRGHGFTVVASCIEECVFRAIYTKENAMIQTTSLLLNAADHSGMETASGVRYLDEDETRATKLMGQGAWARAWGLWAREVEAAGLYASYG
jgi:hypothetical protein